MPVRPPDRNARVSARTDGEVLEVSLAGTWKITDARPGWAGWDVVEAMIPQAEIRDLIIDLRSATAGVGTFRARFDHLAELTGRLADQAIEKAGAKAA